MAYIIAEPCVDVMDKACVEVCPVDCIYEADATNLAEDDRKANTEAIRAFYILKPEYIDASLEAAVQKYGSLDRYLEEGLGVNAQRRGELRDLLMAPQDTQQN